MKSTKPLILITLFIALLAMLSTYSISKESAEKKLKNSVEVHHLQIINELRITLERHSYLPSLLANDSEIINFLRTPINSQDHEKRQEAINLSLELNNNISGTTNIFLMNPKGDVVSSSNWAEKESFITRNFSLRPYFEQASQNILGRYFSSQSKTGERYYFFASSVQFKNKVIGIIVAQVPLSDIASNWIVPDVDFIVTDQNGVIFLSNKTSWNLKAITKLSADFDSGNVRYNNQKISSLNNKNLDLNLQSYQSIKLISSEYMMLSQKMELADWDVRALSRYSIAQKEISRNMTFSGILILLSSLLTILLLNIQSQRNKFRKKTRKELENKVIKRTQALKQSQEGLIQAAKMAALGHLSTGIAHEINNPLAAIRSYADNAEQFLKKDKLDMVESNLKEISKLTETMATITRQLKSFARKSRGELKEVNIDISIINAISIVNSKIISSGTHIHFTKNTNDSQMVVLADEVWLSQILVNLISNAISAKNISIDRQVWINTIDKSAFSNPQYCIEVKDNGTGISATNLSKIFEPFFTTKSSTKGLGLGLSISYNLAEDMNGTLEARNHRGGGALFTLSLPAVPTTQKV